MIKQKIVGMIVTACGVISVLPEHDLTAAILIVPVGIYAIFTKKVLSNYALDDIERRIKEYTQEHKAKDHKQEVLELEYTAVVELMQQLSDKRKAGGRK